MKKSHKDIAVGIILLFVAGIYFYHSFGIRVFTSLVAFSVNSRTIPQIYALILAVLCVILIIQSLLKSRAGEAPPAKAEAPPQGAPAGKPFLAKYSSVLLTFLLMAIYAYTMDHFGFRLSSAIYVFFQTLVLTPKGRITGKIVGGAAVVAVAASLSVDYVFANHLGLILP